MYFKIRKTTPLKKLMEAYCEKQGIMMGSTRFMFEDKRLNPVQTAEQVDSSRQLPNIRPASKMTILLKLIMSKLEGANSWAVHIGASRIHWLHGIVY